MIWRALWLVLLSVQLAGAQTTVVPQGGPVAPANATYFATSSSTDLTQAFVISGRPGVSGSGTYTIYEPTTTFYIKEDFTSGQVTGTAAIAGLHWTSTNGNTPMVAAETGRPGIIQRNNSINGQLASFAPYASATCGNVVPTDTFDTIWMFRLNTADSNTTARAGLMNATNADPGNDGIYLEKLNTDTNWHVVTRASSSQTRQNLQIAASNTAWVNIRIRRTDASTITFTFNDGTTASSATSNTNVPTVQLQPVVHIKAHAAASKTMDLNYFDLLVTGLSR